MDISIYNDYTSSDGMYHKPAHISISYKDKYGEWDTLELDLRELKTALEKLDTNE